MNKITEELENLNFSTREYFLSGIIMFLAGLVIGIILSPKGERIIGSNNGNNSSSCFAEGENNEEGLVNS